MIVVEWVGGPDCGALVPVPPEATHAIAADGRVCPLVTEGGRRYLSYADGRYLPGVPVGG